MDKTEEENVNDFCQECDLNPPAPQAVARTGSPHCCAQRKPACASPVRINVRIIKGYIRPVQGLKADKALFLQTGVAVEKDGDWDNWPKDIRESIVYKSIRDMVDGKRFENTDLYFFGLAIMQTGKPAWKHKTQESFREKRGVEIRNLYQSIESRGLIQIKDVDPTANERDEISLAIGKNGEVLVFDGMHRFAIAALLGIQNIPANVVVRHREWIPRRDALLTRIGRPYQPIEHPEFEHLQPVWSASRVNLILKDLESQCVRTVLDIGSYYGYFPCRLEQAGYECTALEKNKRYFEILCEVRRITNSHFRTIRADIFAMRNVEADCILALNVFHHFLKTKESFTKFAELLRRMKSKVLYFQVHRPNEGQMVGAYRNFGPEEFCRFVFDNSCYCTCKLLGQRKGRNLYRLA